MPAATLRQGLRQPDADRVGLPEIFAEDVAQRDVEDRVGGDDLFLLLRVDRRVGKEADHRLAARLPAGFDLLTLIRLGKVIPTSLNFDVCVPVEGSEPT